MLDNGAFHKAKDLVIPPNIGLLFIPPYSPELNPAENIWAQFKRSFTNLFCKTLEDVSLYIEKFSNKLTKNDVKSTCQFGYI